MKSTSRFTGVTCLRHNNAKTHNASKCLRAEATKIHDRTLLDFSNVNENVEVFVDILNRILHKQMFDGIVVCHWRNNVSVKKHSKFSRRKSTQNNLHNCVILTEEMR